MIFLFASIIFDVAQVLDFVFVFFCYLGDIDSSNWEVSSTAFLFVLLKGLRLTMSKRRVVRFSFVFLYIISISEFSISVVFVFFDQ